MMDDASKERKEIKVFMSSQLSGGQRETNIRNLERIYYILYSSALDNPIAGHGDIESLIFFLHYCKPLTLQHF